MKKGEGCELMMKMMDFEDGSSDNIRDEEE